MLPNGNTPNPHRQEGISLLDDRIEESLLRARRVFLCGPVTSESAREIIRKLWFLEMEAPGQPILFVINSPGGSVDAGLAIWDQVHLISSPVKTLVTGMAASMGSILSLCAASHCRFATPFARFMIHQPSIHGEIVGRASDLDIQAREMMRTWEILIGIYHDKTGLDPEKIRELLDRDTWMSPPEAKELNLFDTLVSTPQDMALLM
jgi:ATP-dependent Clp protease protease subunit